MSEYTRAIPIGDVEADMPSEIRCIIINTQKSNKLTITIADHQRLP